MPKHLTTLVIFAGLLVAPLAATGEIVVIGDRPVAVQHANLPQNGMRQHEVSARFGEPRHRRGPVGRPPISSWDYEGFVVYFEYDRVLHAVVRRR
ncbi:MAG: hypothetical protein ACFCUG_04315 [Thiotrichales bacterium]